MKKIIILLLITSLYNCANKQELDTVFDCKSSNKLSKLKEYKDINKNFRILIPSIWNTKLYYDDNQSDIFSADTLKPLSQSYIFDASFWKDNLIFDNEFDKKISATLLKKEQLKPFKSGFIDTKNYKLYYNLSIGKKLINNKEYQVHALNYYLKSPSDGIIFANTKIYGDSLINERICEFNSILKTIEFLK